MGLWLLPNMSLKMYPVKERAAKLLAVGESISEVAAVVKKSEQTVKLWFLESDFHQFMLDNLGAAALNCIRGYFSKEHADKDRVMVALALLRMNKPVSPPRNGGRKPVSEDETDIDEFSVDQLKRLTGGD